MSIFARIMADLLVERYEYLTMKISATYPKTHCTATVVGKKKRGRPTGRTKGGMNIKPNVICDS